MKSFSKKKIIRQNSLGLKLKKIRLEKDISLQEIYKKINVQVKHLEAIENGQYQDLPGDIYVKAWIKKYANFLEIDSQDLIVDYKIEKGINDKILGCKNTGTSFGFKKSLWEISKIARYVMILIVIISLITYLGLEIKNIASPPSIDIFSPSSNYKTIENSIEIKGQTDPEVMLSINNETVLLEDDGFFNEKINLVVGLNNLQISVKKKHSRTRTIELIIFRESIE